MQHKQRVVCLDFEGTLAPEFWPAAAQKLGIKELEITTREFPDFAELMRRRIKILEKHNIKLSDLIAIAEKLEPLAGAIAFIGKLHDVVPRIIIVSDFAEQLAAPIVSKCSKLTYFGNAFGVDSNGEITHFEFRQDDPKRQVVKALKSLNFEVFAAGDSYNDLPMIEEADKGILFRAPDQIKIEFPRYQTTESYDELLDLLI